MRKGRKMDLSFVLPEECISKIISFTSPRDACRSSLVCRVFESAAKSDAVWEKFLPSDYHQIISNSFSASLLSDGLSKKDLYLRLCDNPVIINNGTMSFAIDKESAKKIYMVGARGLFITWGDTPQYWKWLSRAESRFPEVARLNFVWWFDVKAKIETQILSPKTTYAAYFVFKLDEYRSGFDTRPLQLGVYTDERDDGERHSVFLDAETDMSELGLDRGYEWMQVEMGEFFNENGDDGTLICSLFDFDGFDTKAGLIVEGIELRPKHG